MPDTTVAIKVNVWGSSIGYASYRPGDPAVSFEYDRAFIGSGIELSPLMMPLSDRVYRFPELREESFHGLPGMLADSLPDKFGNAIIDRWLESQGRQRGSLTPLERLTYIGKRGMGALEYEPVLFTEAEVSDSIYLGELVQLASDILNKRKSIYADSMQQLVSVGTSAGGARAKAIVCWNEKTGEFRSGQIDAGEGYDFWIIKFDGIANNRDKEEADRDFFTRVEYAYYLMASDAGINMSECRLYHEDANYHFMTKRFDRVQGEKVHMQSLGAIAHFDFQDAGVHSYEEAVTVCRRLSVSQHEITQLFRRMVFNVIARNQDDHVKNISFLMDKSGRWSLSPAYDVTYAYNPNGLWTSRHQMSIHGKLDNITYQDLLASAAAMSIREGKAAEIISEVTASVRKWPEFAEKAFLSEKQMDFVRKHFVIL